MQHLLQLRREHVIPGIPGCRSEGASVIGQGAVHATWHLGTGKRLGVAINLGADTVSADMPVGLTVYASPGATPDALPPAAIVVKLGA